MDKEGAVIFLKALIKTIEGMSESDYADFINGNGSIKFVKDAPKDKKGASKDNQDSPKDKKGASKDNQDSPKDKKGTSKDNQDSPKDKKGASKDNQDSPKDKKDAPKKDSMGSERDVENDKNSTPVNLNKEIQYVIEKLKNAKDRDEAKSLLQNHQAINTRNDLVALAKALKVHVKKNDKKEVLQDKIIEFAVGVTLRSQAIKNVNLKSSGKKNES